MYFVAVVAIYYFPYVGNAMWSHSLSTLLRNVQRWLILCDLLVRARVSFRNARGQPTLGAQIYPYQTIHTHIQHQDPPTMSTPGPSTQSSRSLNNQVVLEEDEYTEALSQIIARDFFPSLVHLDATNDYLDAVKAQDPELIHASVRRLEEITTPMTRRSTYTFQTPSQTPYAAGPSDTPLRTPGTSRRGDEPPSKRARYDTNMSLDNFQARYTSEDNSSFTQILDDENRKRREKWGWAWEAQKRVEEQRGKMIEGRKRLLIEAPAGPGVRERFTIEAPVPRGLITSGEEVIDGVSSAADSSNGLEEVKEGEGKSDKGKEVALRSEATNEEEEVDVMAPKKDTRPAGVDGWNFKVRSVSF